jgi:hypothetical protein
MAVRCSIEGVWVFMYNSFNAPSWYGSGRDRLDRENEEVEVLYGVELRRDDKRAGRSSMEGEILGERYPLETGAE